MPRLFKTLKRHIAIQTGNIKDYFENKALKKKYPEYVKNEFDNGYYKFVWGIKSSIDFSSAAPCLYSMNDIDICYDREKKEYVLGIETAYWFDDPTAEIEYLESLLAMFIEYMLKQGYNTDEKFIFWMCQPTTSLRAKTISELYTYFKIFVHGYKSVYANGKEQENEDQI